MKGQGRGGGFSGGGTAGRGGRQTAQRGRRCAPNGQLEGSPINAVLGQPELLELILDYAIYDKNVEKRLKTLRSVRLVNTDWLTGVTNVMRKNKEPLFKLTLTKDNSVNGGSPFVEAQGKLLDGFVAAVEQRIEKPFPTFKLKIMEEFFRRENYDSLLACLRQCKQGLLELEMLIPENGGSLPGVLPTLDLPMLKEIVATFTSHRLQDTLRGNELTFTDSGNIIGLIQALLSGSQFLKKLSVPFYRSAGSPTNIAIVPPRNIEYLTFPESITNLELNCLMTNDNLELLVRNKLPNLLTLRMLLGNVSYSEGLLSKIMSNFCEHLRNLYVNRNIYGGPPRQVNFVGFPVMKELKRLELCYYGLELEEGHLPLSICFPKLEIMALYQQTREMLRKWTANAVLNSVETIGLGLIDENKSGRNCENILPFSLESMQRVHLSFPNITRISIRLSCEPQERALKCLFMEMRQLTYLALTVDRSDSIVNSDHWDSVLIGLPVPVITALRDTDYLEKVEVNTKDGVPTIRMLTALKTLDLKAVVKPEDGQEALPPLISDLTFTFALMKMTSLKQLYWHGRFKATNEITNKWRNMGRYITYSSNM